MRRIRLTPHAILIAAVSTTILHFLFTSIVGHYIAVHIGSSTGQIVAEGLVEATTDSPKTSSEDEAKRIYQKMQRKSIEVVSRWTIPLLLISLPIGPVIQPLLNKIRKAWMYEPVLSNAISNDQFKTRAMSFTYLVTGLNSFSFGTVIYLALRFFFKKAAA